MRSEETIAARSMTRKYASRQSKGPAAVSVSAKLRPASASRILATVRRHPTAAFFCLAFAFSWGYWIPVALAGGRLSHFPGLLGPMLAAFMVTTLTKGGAGMKELWTRMIRWRVPARCYAAALIPLATAIVALGVGSLLGRGLPSLKELSNMPGLP